VIILSNCTGHIFLNHGVWMSIFTCILGCISLKSLEDKGDKNIPCRNGGKNSSKNIV